ncbi:MAG: hypothetical protein HN578_05080 [Rhodospirillales bacterium]|nr:hypothetical protein [Rhodospirillales bacterium]MBT3906340.1 hypothetical protein [Rhodospirillaceae bacterium]MBT5036400.1 hypothetical protein [Rhodospirillaceae bacterium]MBT6221533.1 hypothetical protein [Rhodospirillaceae bacterium]MBT6364532.1 hypothetical protein [Rhodospirillaceae bacterium]
MPDRRKKKYSSSTGDGDKRMLKDRRVIPDLRMDGDRRFAEIRRRYSDKVDYSYHH